MQYQRDKFTGSVSKRFWEKVDIRTEKECWLWKGAIGANGYGSFKFDRRSVGAHRMCLSLHTGFMPESDIVAMHSCNNPKCCNPKHLSWGTSAQNTKDAKDQGLLKGHTKSGSKNYAAKLTESQVSVIKERIISGETNMQIARDYDVGHSMISKIRRKRFWASIKPSTHITPTDTA